jgi:hypothetical protein
MIKNRTYQIWRIALAYSLGLLLLIPMVLKEAHHLLSHSHDDETVCETTGADAHWHSEEYGVHQCWVCTCIQIHNFVSTDLIGLKDLPVTLSMQFSSKTVQFINSSTPFQVLRGPPSASA